MLLQLTTATGAMAGTVCGLLAEGTGSSAATSWILPFTARSFIYIATVSVIPELLEDSKLWQSIKEIFALFVGGFYDGFYCKNGVILKIIIVVRFRVFVYFCASTTSG